MVGTHLDRRTVLRGIGGGLTGAAVIGTATAQNASGDWRTYAYDAVNTGYNPNGATITTEVKRQWRFEPGTTIKAPPAVVGDTAYVSGVDGQVYAVTSDGNIQTYSIGDGESDSSVPAEVQSIASAPAVVDDVLYVGSQSGRIHALDINNDEQLWSFSTGGQIRSSPTILDGQLFVGSLDGNLYAIDVVSGDQQWQYETGGPVVTTPAVFDEQVLFGSGDGTLYAVSASDGSERWQYAAGGPLYASPSVSGGRSICATAGGTVVAVENGSEVWSQSLDADVIGSPTLVNDRVLVGTMGGTLRSFDSATGNQEWQASFGGAIADAVTASGETAYVTSQNGTLAGIDVTDGSVQWEFGLESAISTSPVITGDRLIVGTERGEILAFGAPSGLIHALTTGVDRYGQEILGVGAGGATLAGGYLGFQKLRGGSSGGADSSTDEPASPSLGTLSGAGDAPPIVPESERPTPNTHPDLGDRSFEDFEQRDLIGSGAKADVYEAVIDDGTGERTVALKVPRMSDYKTVDTDFFDEFVSEADVWDSIDDHPNIVSVLGWGERPHPWIALEYMEGGNLGEHFETIDRDGVFRHLEEMCEAVHHAHRQGITHTDLKPENVLLTEVAGQQVTKIADWGLATVLLEHSTSVQGLTPAYSAPEQVDPDTYGGTDDRTDIYQLGAVAYEAFTGRLPFEYDASSAVINAVLNESPTPPSEVDEELPAELDDVLLTGMAKEKSDRYETVLHFRDALRQVYHNVGLND